MRESMKLLLKKIINRLLKKFQISRIPTKEKMVYLTFDDGPEPGICEFVLDELKKYGFKATFFCRGDNAEKYPDLLNRIKEEGHTIGNHTYSHLHAFCVEDKTYCNDVQKANRVLKTDLLRPPYGSLSFATWKKLHNDYKIVLWSISSNDSDLKEFMLQESIVFLTNNTHCGDIVLFHFCQKHENETRQILPLYCKWLFENKWISKGL